jgi:hypothetical protein
MMTPQYRRMRCAIIVMATVMILASMLLVGVSLSMAEHIDELVSRMNQLGAMSTIRPAGAVADASIPPTSHVHINSTFNR